VDITLEAGEIEQIFFGFIPEGHDCPPTPTEERSWGRIKSNYR
jgi:hypothetical protein